MAIYVRSAEFMMHRYTESKGKGKVVREEEREWRERKSGRQSQLVVVVAGIFRLGIDLTHSHTQL